jgi:hypothetical protein
MKLHEYWLGLHPLDWEFCFMPVQTYKNFIFICGHGGLE